MMNNQFKKQRILFDSTNLDNSFSYTHSKCTKENYVKSTLKPRHYIGDRYMVHRGLIKGDNLFDALNTPNASVQSPDSYENLSLKNVINTVYQSTSGRHLKLNPSMCSPSQQEKYSVMMSKYNNILRSKLNRCVSVNSDKTFDAPKISKEYVNIVEWDEHDNLIVGLGNLVYKLNLSTTMVSLIVEISERSQSVCSCVKWVHNVSNMHKIAILIGSSNGTVELYSVSQSVSIYKYSPSENNESVSVATAFAYHDKIITIGRSDGSIEHYTLKGKLLYITKFHKKKINHLRWTKSDSKSRERLLIVSSDKISTLWSDNLYQDPSIVCYEACNNDGTEVEYTDCVWNPNKVNQIAVVTSTLNYRSHLNQTDNNTDIHDEFYDELNDVRGSSSVKIIDLTNGNCLKHLTFNFEITAVSWSQKCPHELLIATFDPQSPQNCTLQLVNIRPEINHDFYSIASPKVIRSARPIKTMNGHNGPILNLVLGPNSSGSVCSTSADQSISIWSCFKFSSHQPIHRQTSKPRLSTDLTSLESMFRNSRMI